MFFACESMVKSKQARIEAKQEAAQQAAQEERRQRELERKRKQKEREDYERKLRQAELAKKIEEEKKRLASMTVKERMREKGYQWVEGRGFVPVRNHVNKLEQLELEKAIEDKKIGSERLDGNKCASVNFDNKMNKKYKCIVVDPPWDYGNKQVGRCSFQGCLCSSSHYHLGNSISVVFRMVDRIARQLCFWNFYCQSQARLPAQRKGKRRWLENLSLPELYKPIFTYYNL